MAYLGIFFLPYLFNLQCLNMKKLEIKSVIFPLQGYSLNFEEEKKRLTNAQS